MTFLKSFLSVESEVVVQKLNVLSPELQLETVVTN